MKKSKDSRDLARAEAEGYLAQARASAWLPYSVIGLLAGLSLAGLVAAAKFGDDQSKASAMQTLRDIGVGLLGALSLGGGAVAVGAGARGGDGEGEKESAGPPTARAEGPASLEPMVFPVPERAALWDEPSSLPPIEVAAPTAQPLSPTETPLPPPGAEDSETASDGDRFDTDWSYNDAA